MDELEISGKRHISSARAAKQFKYHSDYIGQLVRGGKVAGQKVGRAWYVDEESLAEYLGKETPARGPVLKEEKVVAKKEEPATNIKSGGPEEVPVAEHEASFFKEAESEVRGTSSGVDTDLLVLQNRKSGRQHVIAALDSNAHKEALKKTEEPVFVQPVIEVQKEIKEEVKNQEVAEEEDEIQVFTMDDPEVDAEQETYIPVKITAKPRQEPEDSFYKVSGKGLRYISGNKTSPAIAKRSVESAAPQYQEALPVRTLARSKSRTMAKSFASAASLVLVAGILSLGAGVLVSFYLHSITTIEGTGQTSTVLLSN